MLPQAKPSASKHVTAGQAHLPFIKQAPTGPRLRVDQQLQRTSAAIFQHLDQAPSALDQGTHNLYLYRRLLSICCPSNVLERQTPQLAPSQAPLSDSIQLLLSLRLE